MIPNINTLIKRFINENSLSQVQDQRAGDLTPPKNSMGLQHQSSTKVNNDFGSANRKYEQKNFAGTGFKKPPTVIFSSAAQQNEPEEVTSTGDYIIQPEYKAEIAYQELLPKLLAMDEHLHAQIGCWRQHVEFWKNLPAVSSCSTCRSCKTTSLIYCSSTYKMVTITCGLLFVSASYKYWRTSMTQRSGQHLRGRSTRSLESRVLFRYAAHL